MTGRPAGDPGDRPPAERRADLYVPPADPPPSIDDVDHMAGLYFGTHIAVAYFLMSLWEFGPPAWRLVSRGCADGWPLYAALLGVPALLLWWGVWSYATKRYRRMAVPFWAALILCAIGSCAGLGWAGRPPGGCQGAPAKHLVLAASGGMAGRGWPAPETALRRFDLPPASVSPGEQIPVSPRQPSNRWL